MTRVVITYVYRSMTGSGDKSFYKISVYEYLHLSISRTW